MNWQLILLLTGIMLFAYWLNYIMGSPLSTKREDVDPKAILFSFPLFLAERRLKQAEILQKFHDQFIEELRMTKDISVIWGLKNDNRLDTFIAGREFFTWERSLLCPICLHWWLSVIVGIVLLSFDLLNAMADFLQAALTYLVLHLIIRKIS